MARKKSININKFMEKFNEEYHLLYENNDNVAGYSEAVKAFDDSLNNEQFKKFVIEFTEFRGDIISSDREAGAFMFAFESMS